MTTKSIRYFLLEIARLVYQIMSGKVKICKLEKENLDMEEYIEGNDVNMNYFIN